MKEAMLEVRDLRKRYGRKSDYALKGISFTVMPGEIHAFVGANGAGKTTAIKCIVDAYKKWSGEIRIRGIENSKIEAKQYVAYLPEHHKLPVKMRVRNYLYSMAILHGMSGREARQWVNTLIKEMGMENYASSRSGDLSSGQTRKLFIAQSRLTTPSLYILDEPAANLDPMARRELFDFLIQERNAGKSVFISTHILDEIQDVADSVTFLHEGQILYTGRVHDENIKDKYFQFIGNKDEEKDK